MKKIVVHAAMLMGIIYLSSCAPITNPDKQIRDRFLAQIYDDSETTYGNLFTRLAGIRGEVKYEVFTEHGESDPNIKIIQVNVDKKDPNAEIKTAMFQYQINTSTDFTKLRYLAINGEAQDKIAESLIIGLMLLESSYN